MAASLSNPANRGVAVLGMATYSGAEQPPADDEVAEGVDDDGLCLCCGEQRASVVVSPCNHLVACEACGGGLQGFNCPRCGDHVLVVVNIRS